MNDSSELTSAYSGATFAQQHRQIGDWLLAAQPYWRFRPFALSAYPTAWPRTLADWLGSLSEDEVMRLDDDPDLPNLIGSHISSGWAPEVPSLPESATVVCTLPKQLCDHVPGRKWHQIERFVGCVPSHGTRVVDWAAGKGHLSRVWAAVHQGVGVTGFDADPELSSVGRRLHRRTPLGTCSQVSVSVHSPEVRAAVGRADHVIGLHPCGDLHLTLIQAATRMGVPCVSYAPCCYHVASWPHYRPLSQSGRNQTVVLDKLDLALPSQRIVTGGRRVHRIRRQEILWRLALDELQKDVTGSSTYRTMPSIPKRLLSGTFPDFCRALASRWDLVLPEQIDTDSLLNRAEERHHLVRRVELVRHAARDAIERWLILDQACFLEEQGYRVQLSCFCERAVTPRNTLLHARKRGDQRSV